MIAALADFSLRGQTESVSQSNSESDSRCAEEVTDGSQYFVLLMITDGVISDMAQTKEAVVN
eukprot:superscaffoldBa00000770_g7123